MFKRPSVIILLIVCAVLAFFFGVLAAASTKERIAPGIAVAGVPVGKLSAEQAEMLINRRIAEPIDKKVIVITAGNKERRVKVSDLDVSIPISAAISQALKKSSTGPFWSEGLRQLTGSDDNIELVPRPSQKKIKEEARKINASLIVPAKDAEIDLSASGPSLRDGRPGQAVKGGRGAVGEAINSGLKSGKSTLLMKTTEPKVSRVDLEDDYSIVVVKSKFRAYFYKGDKKIKSYPVAIGQPAYPTPEGRFQINGKQINPVWSVPNSAWAGELAGQTVAGGTAANPLVARWMGVANGVGFHGTREEGSLGSAASHGCLRMKPADIIEWYPKVPEGTPVLITG